MREMLDLIGTVAPVLYALAFVSLVCGVIDDE